MTTTNSPILNSKDTAQQRIYYTLRTQLQNGNYAINSRLPTAQELAAQLGTSTFTIHKAMEMLVADGLLERRRKVGTIVRSQSISLRQIGIYCQAEWTIDDVQGSFVRILSEHLRIQLALRGINIRFFYDFRHENYGQPLAELVTAIKSREIQALILPAFDYDWVHQLDCPLAMITNQDFPFRVDFDRSDFVRQGLTALAAKGCKTIGVISLLIRGSEVAGQNGWGADDEFYASLDQMIAETGLQMRQEWFYSNKPVEKMVQGQSIYRPEYTDYARFGYQSMKQLHASGSLPDGLLVFSDITALGVINAISELGIRPPQDLQLAIHRNRGLRLFAPFSYTAVEADPGEIAAALLEQLDRLLANQPARPLLVRHHLYETEY